MVINVFDKIDKNSQLYKNRLGFYRVGDNLFRNRFQAMSFAKKAGQPISWNFNEETFSKIPWMKKIEVSLPELYKLRAQQLRNNYDYLILNFSGGIDSLTVLHSFIDNNIFLDEILIQVPKNFNANANDLSAKNYWSEIEYQAIPHLKKYEHLIDKRTKIRFQDIEKPIIELFSDEHWYEKVSPHCNVSIPGFARIISGYKDPNILNLAMKGLSIGRIYGAEKPKIKIKGNIIFGYFNDLSLYMHNAPGSDNESTALLDHHQYEPFFWTPFFPEIVIKQSQIIAEKIKSDARYKTIFLNTGKWFNIEKLISPLIYHRHAEVIWKTDKITDEIIRSSDAWFWDTVDSKTKNSFLNLIQWYDTQVDLSEFNNETILNGLKVKESKYYIIDKI